MRSALQHVRYAFRALGRDRGAVSFAIVSLALAIAANGTVFSLVQAVEFPRLIYPDAGEIVFLESIDRARSLSGLLVSAPDAVEIARTSRTLRGVAIMADQTSVAGEPGRRARWQGRRVSPSFFDTMAVAALHGRGLSALDEPGVIVLSHAMWQALGGDPNLVGNALPLDGGTVSVVGVMPPQFDADADFWTPLGSTAGFARNDRQFSVYARLAPASSIDDATRELDAISRRLQEAFPDTNTGWTMFPVSLRRLHGRDSRGAFLLLQAAVVFVLLVACANVANILLARGARRRHEMAVRLSLGATRMRLLGQLLTESVVLAAIGGAAGIILAFWGIRVVRGVGGFPEVIAPSPNAMVLAFTILVTGATGILCGLVPALRASAASPRDALAISGRGLERSRRRIRTLLVASQVACAMVLGTGGLLLVESMVNRYRVDLGFNPERSVQGSLSLDGSKYGDEAVIRATTRELLDRLRSHPFVDAAGAITWALPTPAGASRQFVAIDDGAAKPGARHAVEAVTPGYFAAMGIALTAGRAFDAADREGSAAVAVINEELARQLWPDRSPMDRQLRLGTEPGAPVVTVVGVVRSVRRSAMHDAVVGRAYVPFAQYPNRQLTLVVRGRSDDAPLIDTLRAEITRADPMLLPGRIRTTLEDLGGFVAPLRMITWLLAGFAGAAALLTALGVYGAMSYSVTERQRELAIRTALGADRAALLRLVFVDGGRVTIAGLVVGIPLALASARLLTAFLFGVRPADPAAFAVAIVALMAISAIACLRPAHTAATTDPNAVLRRE